MNYEAVLKQNASFTVPEVLFNEKFGAFEKSYSGDVGGHKVPAWRAFEIAFKRGKLHGDTKSDDKSPRRAFGRRSKSSSYASDDGSEQVGAD